MAARLARATSAQMPKRVLLMRTIGCQACGRDQRCGRQNVGFELVGVGGPDGWVLVEAHFLEKQIPCWTLPIHKAPPSHLS
jgi:hypothetical protein